MAIYRVITHADIAKCPKQSILPAHFTDDGCLCSQRSALEAELKQLLAERKAALELIDPQIAEIRELLSHA